MNNIKKLIKILRKFFHRPTKSEKFYDIAVDYLGEKIEERPEFGSASVINFLYSKLTGREIGGESSTYELFWFLQNNKKRFKEVFVGEPGDIIISPTSCGFLKESIGNVGVIGYDDQIFSINLENCKFDNHLGMNEWKMIYGEKGFPIRIFKIK